MLDNEAVRDRRARNVMVFVGTILDYEVVVLLAMEQLTVINCRCGRGGS